MKRLALVAILLLTASCVSQKTKEASIRAEKAYHVALNHNTVTCKGATTCRTAFELTEGYIQNNSNMPIRKLSDNAISTYEPVDPVAVGMTATMTSGTGHAAIITIKVECAGLSSEMDKSDSSRTWQPLCLKRASSIYNGFRPYVERHINE